MNHYIHYTVWDEINYPFPNFNSAIVEVFFFSLIENEHIMICS